MEPKEKPQPQLISFSEEYYGLYCTEGAKKVFFQFTMPCGTKVSYPINGIPEVDVPCPCGNPDHWIIKYIKDF